MKVIDTYFDDEDCVVSDAVPLRRFGYTLFFFANS